MPAAKTKKRGYLVAIDGPAGAGKSTVSKKLAEALLGKLLDTGAMYRGVAYHSVKKNLDSENELASIARSLGFRAKRNSSVILVNGKDLGQKLRTERVSERASAVSLYKSVRKILTQRQRELAWRWARRVPVIVEGRDIGTVVFPDAPFKFFVTADAKVRAKRRLEQLKKNGFRGTTLKQVLKQNEKRDKQDSTRRHAPLRCAEDAIVVDTSSMDIGQVVHFMEDHIRGRLKLARR